MSAIQPIKLIRGDPFLISSPYSTSGAHSITNILQDRSFGGIVKKTMMRLHLVTLPSTSIPMSDEHQLGAHESFVEILKFRTGELARQQAQRRTQSPRLLAQQPSRLPPLVHLRRLWLRHRHRLRKSKGSSCRGEAA